MASADITKYDTKSIMHYPGFMRGEIFMTDKLTGERIEENKNMSRLDIEKLNKMYPCNNTDLVCGKYFNALWPIIYGPSNQFNFINKDPVSTQAMQDEIKLLEKEIVVLENDSRKLNGLYDERGKQIQNLQNKLDTCDNGAIFGIQGNNQVCELKIEGKGHKLIIPL